MRFVWTSWKEAYDERQYFYYSDAEAYSGWLDRFRQREPGKKADNAYRILVLGDSFSKGGSISDPQDTWPRIVERKLGSRVGQDRRVEVINLANSGFTTLNEFETLEGIGWKTEPDLIILQFYINDALPSKPFVKSINEYKLWNIRDLIGEPSVHSFFEEHSYFYSFLNEHLKIAQMKISKKGDYHQLYDEDFVGWRECQAALLKIAQSTTRKGVRVVFVVFPMFTPGEHTRQTYPYTDIHDTVIAIAKRCNFITLDLLDVFIDQKKDFRMWWALRLDGHPNIEAHRIAAEAIEQTLLQKRHGLLFDLNLAMSNVQ